MTFSNIPIPEKVTKNTHKKIKSHVRRHQMKGNSENKLSLELKNNKNDIFENSKYSNYHKNTQKNKNLQKLKKSCKKASKEIKNIQQLKLKSIKSYIFENSKYSKMIPKHNIFFLNQRHVMKPKIKISENRL